jgi:Tfp pilus assembly protein PilF
MLLGIVACVEADLRRWQRTNKTGVAMSEQDDKGQPGSGANQGGVHRGVPRLPSGGWTAIPGVLGPPPRSADDSGVGTAEVDIHEVTAAVPSSQLDDESDHFLDAMAPPVASPRTLQVQRPVITAAGDEFVAVFEQYRPHAPLSAPPPVFGLTDDRFGAERGGIDLPLNVLQTAAGHAPPVDVLELSTFEIEPVASARPNEFEEDLAELSAIHVMPPEISLPEVPDSAIEFGGQVYEVEAEAVEGDDFSDEDDGFTVVAEDESASRGDAHDASAPVAVAASYVSEESDEAASPAEHDEHFDVSVEEPDEPTTETVAEAVETTTVEAASVAEPDVLDVEIDLRSTEEITADVLEQVRSGHLAPPEPPVYETPSPIVETGWTVPLPAFQPRPTPQVVTASTPAPENSSEVDTVVEPESDPVSHVIDAGTSSATTAEVAVVVPETTPEPAYVDAGEEAADTQSLAPEAESETYEEPHVDAREVDNSGELEASDEEGELDGRELDSSELDDNVSYSVAETGPVPTPAMSVAPAVRDEPEPSNEPRTPAGTLASGAYAAAMRRSGSFSGVHPGVEGESLHSAFGVEGASTGPLNIFAPPLEGGEPRGTHTWVTRFDLFRTQVQGLARTQRWKQLAAVTAHALLYSPWAIGANRTALLVDLARLYRDRLDDAEHAEEAFAALAREQPANPEALAYLVEVATRRNDWRGVYGHYLRAVEGTWDVNERLEWTRHCAAIASERLQDSDLVVEAWEHLWRLGDGLEQANVALASSYRAAGRWRDLAHFIAVHASAADPARSRLLRREEAEVLRFAAGDAAGAAEVLESLLAEVPEDLIVTRHLAAIYAEQGRIDALERLAQQGDVVLTPGTAAWSRLLLVADAVREAGHADRALPIYRALLAAEPENANFYSYIAAELRRSERWSELLELLRERAARSEPATRGQILHDAATVAERSLRDYPLAIALLREEAAAIGMNVEIASSLVRLGEEVGDTALVTESLGVWSELVRGRAQWCDVLRRSAQHASAHGGDARAAWEQVLALRDADVDASEALLAIAAASHDHAATTTELRRRIEISPDSQQSEALARRLAAHLGTVGAGPDARIASLLQVLDYAPWDTEVLNDLVGAYALAGASGERAVLLEQLAARSTSPDETVAIALELGEINGQSASPELAAAAFERALRLEPDNTEALDALVAVYLEAGAWAEAVGCLEAAADRAANEAKRIELLRRVFNTVPATEPALRFAVQRRIFVLGDRSEGVVESLESLARASGRAAEFAAILERCASDADVVSRAAYLGRLTAWLTKEAAAPGRAFAGLLAGITSEQIDATTLTSLRTLAAATGRHEELVALLDRLAVSSQPLNERKARAFEAAEILERAIGDHTRAFFALRWVLELDPADVRALSDARRLATSANLHASLDALLTELGDRTPDATQRSAFLAEREELARGPLRDAAGATTLRLRRFRFDADAAVHVEALATDARARNAWRFLLPSLEAFALGQAFDAAVTAMVALRWELDGGRADRALDLFRVVSILQPSNTEALAAVARIAGAAGKPELLVATQRRVAAQLRGTAEGHALLAATAAGASALDASLGIAMHRRLLEEAPDAVASLDVLIAAWRQSGAWATLQSGLRRRIELLPADADNVMRLVEIGVLAEEKLHNPHDAVTSYRLALTQAPERTDVHARFEQIVERIDDPTLSAEWLRMELDRATGADAEARRIRLAAYQRDRLGDTSAAIATLIDRFNPAECGDELFEAAASALHDQRRWIDLVAALLARAQARTETPARSGLLERARSAMLRDTAVPAPLRRQVLEGLIALHPAEVSARRLYARELLALGDLTAWIEQIDALSTDATPGAQLAALWARSRVASHGALPDSAELAHSLLEQQPFGDEAVRLARAAEAYAANDISRYVAIRREHAEQQAPHDAALVLCHLAEVLDENGADAAQIADLYREARRIDSHCSPAAEALKGIGRRLRSVRPAAALLPEEGERELSLVERAARLAARAAADPAEALEWATRAVLIAPSEPAYWTLLADLLQAGGAVSDAFRARWMAVNAWRAHAPLLHADRAAEVASLRGLASCAQQLGDETSQQFARAALGFVGFDSIAGAVAQANDARTSGAPAEALWMLDMVADSVAGASESERLDWSIGRGLALVAAGEVDAAADAIGAVLAERPLDGQALAAQAAIARQTGDVVGEAVALLRTLAVTGQPVERAAHLLSLGTLLEDRLGLVDEGGACFEVAFESGVSSRELLHRVFRHHQRTGQLERGLEVVDGLLSSATETAELAELWLARGQILLARGGSEHEAVEAFDMALSYDPACHSARLGLAEALERLGDWDQLLQILEAVVDAGSPAQRAEAFVRMADIAETRLSDSARAEGFLRESIAALATLQATQRLEAIVALRQPGSDEHIDLLGSLVNWGPPWYATASRIGEQMLGRAPRQAWCILAPMLMIRGADESVKAQLREMRRDYERPPLLVVTPALVDAAWATQPIAALRAVLTELDGVLHPCGGAAAELEVREASDVSPHSSIGRAFATMCDAAGMHGTSLVRAGEMRVPIAAYEENGAVRVAVRGDLFQQMARAEVGFVLGYAIELARSGNRVVAALSADSRTALVAGLLAACGLRETTGARARAWADRIREVVDSDTLAVWAERLSGIVDVGDSAVISQTFADAVMRSARHVGLLAGADLYQVSRLLARLEPAVERPAVFGTIEQFDELLAGWRDLRELVSFACSPTFRSWMASATLIAAS